MCDNSRNGVWGSALGWMRHQLSSICPKSRLQRESCHWQWPLMPFLLYSTSVKTRGAEQHWWSCSFWSGRRSRWGLLQTDGRSLMFAGSDPHGGLYLSWYPLVEHHNKAWAMPWRVHRWQIPKKDEPTRRGAQMDLTLTNKEGFVRDGKVQEISGEQNLAEPHGIWPWREEGSMRDGQFSKIIFSKFNHGPALHVGSWARRPEQGASLNEQGAPDKTQR